ncbi:MAG: hypothetical protein EOO90_19280 [Pedobacter sp.]|nr:MAG: hypothetical protein EOO90_19280 [Pedobacter sp.]
MKLLNYTLACIGIMITMSCSKDLGNYEYQDINELTIKEVNTEYTLRTGIDTLRIKPNIAASMDEADTTRYQHRWILKTGVLTADTIGRYRNFEFPIRLNPGTHDLYYRVLDKKTDVVSIVNIKLLISTPYSRGLLIMGENQDGSAEAEMLSMLADTVHVKGILSNSGLPKLREPLSLVHTGGPDKETKLWAFTKSGSYFLDRATMTGTTANTFSRSTFLSETVDPETLHPVALAPQIRTVAGLIGGNLYRAIITKAGDVFASMLAIVGGDFYNNPVNRVASNPQTRIKAAPYILYTINAMNTFMWYDLDNQRPAGRTFVYAENTRNTDGGSTNGNSFAIVKDPNNTHHIYKFYANGTNPAKRAAYTVKSIATDFEKAKFYAFSSNRTVVFYAVDNRLYAYDYNPNFEKVYQFGEIGTDVISMIKFDTQMDHVTNSLYIATYNNDSKGTLRRYRVGTNPNVVELLLQPNSTWTDMVKIKDINWRAVN